ncbi:unnamed protein product [Arctogadus glacialis]
MQDQRIGEPGVPELPLTSDLCPLTPDPGYIPTPHPFVACSPWQHSGHSLAYPLRLGFGSAGMCSDLA